MLLDSVPSIALSIGHLLVSLEIAFTLIFTIEYVLRVYSSPHARRYIFSFYGIVDKSAQDRRVPLGSTLYSSSCRIPYVRRRGPRFRLYEHSDQYLLGDCYLNDGWVRGHLSEDTSGTDDRLHADDSGVWSNGGTNRHSDSRAQ